MTDPDQRRRLAEELDALRRELDELKRSLPKHSLTASQWMRIEELEEAIAAKQAELDRKEG